MEENRKNFYDYLARVQEARDQMTLGWDSIKSDYEARPFRQRVKDRLRTFGINRPELNSIYSPNEQNVMAKSDAISNMFVRGMDLGMGGLQLSTMLLPSAGKLSTIAGVGSMAAALGGMGGLATGLGSLAMYSNPYTAAASVGLRGLSFGVQESILDPLANTRMFQSTANTSFRGVIGGLNSNTGRGGLSMSNSFQLGRGIESIRTNNRDLEPEKINQFLEAAANLPQMGFGVNADKAIENVSKFMDIMVKLSKQFKGKETELVQSMTQFSQMGMSLQEAERNIQNTSRMGTMLGIDSSKIMMAGGNVAQSMIGTNISQSTGYYIGSQAYIQADMMRQRGQLTPTQLLNFGGVQGISQMVASSQNTLLNSSLSNMFLKSVYTKQNGGVGAGVDFDLVDKLSKGTMSLEEIRNRAANITLSPEANMQFGFDKESVISALGDKAPDVANSMFNTLAARNPYGNTLQGRSKFAMQLGIAPDMNSARIFAQQNMTYNPIMNDVMKSFKQDQYMAGMDPAYGGFQGFGIATQNMETNWKRLSRGHLGFLNSETDEGVQFRTGFGNFITGGVGTDVMNFYKNISQDQNIKGFSPFEGIKDGKDLLTKYNTRRTDNVSDRDKSLETVGRRSLYSNLNLYQGRDFDMALKLQNRLIDKYDMNSGKNEFTDADKLNKTVEEETNNYLEGKSDNRFLITTSGQKLQGDEYRKAISGIIQGALTYNNNSISKNTPLIEEAKNKLVLSGKEMMGIKGGQTTGWSVAGGVLRKYGESLFTGGIAGLVDSTKLMFGSKTLDDYTSVFKNYNLHEDSFANKFNNRSVKDRFDMVSELVNDKNNDFGNYGLDKFGFSSLKDGEKDSILNNDAVKEYTRISKLPEAERKLEMDKVESRQTQENVSQSINTIFGSSGYRNMSRRYGGSDLIKGIVQEFLGKGTANKEDMKMTEDQLTKMKKDLKGQTGLGEIIQYGKIVDDHLEIGDMSDKKKERLTNNFLAQHGGLIQENAISSAKQLWDDRKGDKATTIQDYAVAFARGLQIYNTGSDNLVKWNDAKKAGSVT